jgi:hypothetical protein
VADTAVGFAAVAHPQLDDPVAGLRIPRRGPRRLPRRVRRRGLHRGIREGDRGAGAGEHHRDLGAADRAQVCGADRSGCVACPLGRARPGASTVANVPALQAGVPAGITMLTPSDYRNPSQLPDGGVLVVGASASGVQIAAELHRSGRPVTLAVGEHVRMPRTYRG